MRTVLLLIFLSIIISCQGQKSDLALKLEVGKGYRQNTNTKSTIIQEIEGQKINMEMSINGTLIYLVKSIEERGYVVDVEFKSLGMSMQTPYGSLEVSSDKNEPDNVLSVMLAAINNKSFEVIMTKTGKVLEVNKIENLFGSAMSQLDNLQISAEQKEQAKAQVMKAYGAEAFRGNTEMVTAIFPDNPVNKGDKWVVKTKLESGMSGEIITDYDFFDQTPDYFIIKGNSIITMEDKEAYVESNGMRTKYDMTGSMQSNIKVDKKTGWIIEANINQELHGDVYIKENPKLPNGLKFPMSVTNVMTITN